MLVLLVGPSGVGKSSVVKALRQRHPEFHLPRSATTRPRRPGEGDESYYFLSESGFDAWVTAGKFLEWQVVHQSARYGTVIAEIVDPVAAGKTVLREIDMQGLEALKSHPAFSGAHPLKLLSIFLLPESTEQLIARITNRAPMSPEELRHRLESMEKELAKASLCDASVVNHDGHLEDTVNAVDELIAGHGK
jgi:guanylate kinase